MTRIDPHSIAHYLDRRTEAAIQAALRHLADTIRTGSDAMSADVDDLMSHGGAVEPLTADEVDAYADALANDTWLCETATPPETRYVVEPQRDSLADQPGDETRFVRCDDAEAHLWAIFDTSGTDPEWIDDRDTRGAAEAVARRMNDAGAR